MTLLARQQLQFSVDTVFIAPVIRGLVSINGFWQWLFVFLLVDLVGATAETIIRGHGLLHGVARFLLYSIGSVLMAALVAAFERRRPRVGADRP